MKNERQSNLELLRIVCMIMIISGHILTQTSARQLTFKDGFDYYFIVILSNGLRWGINCFVMIGAWFLVDMPFKAKRFVNLWLQILFYSVLIDTICLVFKLGDYSIIWEVQAFFPIIGRPIWFGAEYLLMLLFTPFMNKLLTEKKYICKKLLVIVGFFIIISSTIFPIEHTMPMFSEIIWFCFLYLLVGYLKHIDIAARINPVKLNLLNWGGDNNHIFFICRYSDIE